MQRDWSNLLVAGSAGTAPAAMVNRAGDLCAYAPVKSPTGQFSLTAFEGWARRQVWNLDVPQAITSTPVLQSQSVYFLAGHVLYRVNAASGAICWKYTLPLKPDDALTDLAFAGGEIRASGPGLLVRIAERTEERQPDAVPRAPAVLPGLSFEVPPAGR